MTQKSQHLQRSMGLTAALTTVMGTVIGGGVFFKISTLAAVTKSPGLLIAIWIIAGLLTIAGGLCLAELATAIPEAGGAVNYIEAAYGKLPSFLLGWAQMLIYYPANIAALSLIFGQQLVGLMNWPTHQAIPVAIIAACSITALNLLGARFGGVVQSITLFIKLIPIALIIIFGLTQPAAQPVALFSLTPGGHLSWFTALNGGLLATMFAYDGWISVGNMAGELKNPSRHLPIAIILGLGLTTLVYALINLAFLKTLPLTRLISDPTAAATSASVIFGHFGGRLVTIGILVSVYGAINGYTMTGMRVGYAMGVNNAIPFSRNFRKITRRTKVPLMAAFFQLGLTLIMLSLGNFNFLTDMLVFVMWIFNTMLFIAVFILRRHQPELVRPYRVLGYPFIPIVAIIGGLFIVISTLFTQPFLAALGLALTALGIPIYYWHQHSLRH